MKRLHIVLWLALVWLCPSAASADGETLRIATFNIQIFGRTKAHNLAIVNTLATIIRRYDVVAVQEVKDVTGEAPWLLLRAINEQAGAPYGLILSPRTGLQPDDAFSQEAYAVYYDLTKVVALPGSQLYDDSAQDLFQREPFVVHLQAGAFQFLLIDIHTQPTRALSEIGGLTAVFAWAQNAFPDVANIMALGDFNASCGYASPRQLDNLALRGAEYSWLIPDTANSNLAAGSSCAYDRIVANQAAGQHFTGRWAVDEIFSDRRISDHFPVWAEFQIAPEAPTAGFEPSLLRY